jgi:hypothetical protein
MMQTTYEGRVWISKDGSHKSVDLPQCPVRTQRVKPGNRPCCACKGYRRRHVKSNTCFTKLPGITSMLEYIKKIEKNVHMSVITLPD